MLKSVCLQNQNKVKISFSNTQSFPAQKETPEKNHSLLKPISDGIARVNIGTTTTDLLPIKSWKDNLWNWLHVQTTITQ